MRMFNHLYERLLNLKLNEKQVQEDVQRSNMSKAANDLRLMEKTPSDYFADISPSANYYSQTVSMLEEVVKSELDHSQFEELLRRFYIGSGWQLYHFERLLSALVRYALNILVSDNKDKSLDIINLFYKDRKEDESTHNTELTYRKRVQGLVREGDMFRIRYVRVVPLEFRVLLIFLSRIVAISMSSSLFSRERRRRIKATNSPSINAGPTTSPPSPCATRPKGSTCPT